MGILYSFGDHSALVVRSGVLSCLKHDSRPETQLEVYVASWEGRTGKINIHSLTKQISKADQ